MRYLVTWCQQR